MTSYTPGTSPYGSGGGSDMAQQPDGAGRHDGATPYPGEPQYGARPQHGSSPHYGAGPQAGSHAPGPAGMPGIARTAGARPYGNVRRTGYGLLWAFYTTALVIGGFATLFGGDAVGLLAVALGLICGYYDWKIWTFRARRLLFLIIW